MEKGNREKRWKTQMKVKGRTRLPTLKMKLCEKEGTWRANWKEFTICCNQQNQRWQDEEPSPFEFLERSPQRASWKLINWMSFVIIAEVCRTFNLFLLGSGGSCRWFWYTNNNQAQELFKNEIVCRKLNALYNISDPCVTRFGNMIGWVVHDNKCVEMEVEESLMVCGTTWDG
jgi:hypothetical protein